MLVLLIIFMVTAPMLTTGLHVNPPQAKAAQKLDLTDHIDVTADDARARTLSEISFAFRRICVGT